MHENVVLRIVIERLRCGPRGCISAVINLLKTPRAFCLIVDPAHAIDACDRRVLSIRRLRFCHVSNIRAVITRPIKHVFFDLRCTTSSLDRAMRCCHVASNPTVIITVLHTCVDPRSMVRRSRDRRVRSTLAVDPTPIVAPRHLQGKNSVQISPTRRNRRENVGYIIPDI